MHLTTWMLFPNPLLVYLNWVRCLKKYYTRLKPIWLRKGSQWPVLSICYQDPVFTSASFLQFFRIMSTTAAQYDGIILKFLHFCLHAIYWEKRCFISMKPKPPVLSWDTIVMYVVQTSWSPETHNYHPKLLRTCRHRGQPLNDMQTPLSRARRLSKSFWPTYF